MAFLKKTEENVEYLGERVICAFFASAAMVLKFGYVEMAFFDEVVIDA